VQVVPQRVKGSAVDGDPVSLDQCGKFGTQSFGGGIGIVSVAPVSTAISSAFAGCIVEIAIRFGRVVDEGCTSIDIVVSFLARRGRRPDVVIDSQLVGGVGYHVGWWFRCSVAGVEQRRADVAADAIQQVDFEGIEIRLDGVVRPVAVGVVFGDDNESKRLVYPVAIEFLLAVRNGERRQWVVDRWIVGAAVER